MYIWSTIFRTFLKLVQSVFSCLALSDEWFDMMADPTPSDFSRISRTVFSRTTREYRERRIWYAFNSFILNFLSVFSWTLQFMLLFPSHWWYRDGYFWHFEWFKSWTNRVGLVVSSLKVTSCTRLRKEIHCMLSLLDTTVLWSCLWRYWQKHQHSLLCSLVALEMMTGWIFANEFYISFLCSFLRYVCEGLNMNNIC